MGRLRTASAVARKWAVDELARNIHRINITLDGVGDEQWVLLQSDVHWDNPLCDRELLEQHWREARERDAPIIDNGDFFCAMGGKFDKRSNKDGLRPEHQVANYLDALVYTSADALKPYQDLLTVRGQGNHETSIKKVIRPLPHPTDRFSEPAHSAIMRLFARGEPGGCACLVRLPRPGTPAREATSRALAPEVEPNYMAQLERPRADRGRTRHARAASVVPHLNGADGSHGRSARPGCMLPAGGHHRN